MKISELKAKQGNVELTAEVKELGPVREFSKFGKEGRVANATIADESGEVVLTLWNEQIEQVQEGNTIHIVNGYVGEWQGNKQLTTGKFGTLEVVNKSGGQADPEKNQEPHPPKSKPAKKDEMEKGHAKASDYVDEESEKSEPKEEFDEQDFEF